MSENKTSIFPLVVFTLGYLAWSYIISMNKDTRIPQWDDMIVYLVILVPLFFIVKCMLSGNCGLYVWFLTVSLIGYTSYLYYKMLPVEDTTQTPPADTTQTPPVEDNTQTPPTEDTTQTPPVEDNTQTETFANFR